MRRNWMLLCCLAVMMFQVVTAIAQDHAKSETSPRPFADTPLLPANSNPTDENALPRRTKSTPQAHTTKSEQSERAEGEQRFRENCGRCHQPPHKFSPRVMAAAIRHMRVRAMLTDEDMRLILKYMTQ